MARKPRTKKSSSIAQKILETSVVEPEIVKEDRYDLPKDEVNETVYSDTYEVEPENVAFTNDTFPEEYPDEIKVDESAEILRLTQQLDEANEKYLALCDKFHSLEEENRRIKEENIKLDIANSELKFEISKEKTENRILKDKINGTPEITVTGQQIFEKPRDKSIPLLYNINKYEDPIKRINKDSGYWN